MVLVDEADGIMNQHATVVVVLLLSSIKTSYGIPWGK